MRKGSLFLVFALSFAPMLHAEEASTATTPVEPVAEASAELNARLATVEAQNTKAQLTRLQQENQQLRQQLQEQQEQSLFPTLTAEQQWFAVGGGVGALAFMFGALISRGRRRRQWLN
ncbi:hypothetical protein HW090_14935 [Pseudomonas sp. ABC1]|uniref:hypothetical protein n=1 Tax=Pseudomonas sp. ABC1 TaxID=2748080 RepID=UPI0015C35494|nr:hypothetical protein [Pseudomonas sp. ABC1]QLF94416.1 hypothetical protein HW090_14935 [Pseudomonas sp. ABC1]